MFIFRQGRKHEQYAKAVVHTACNNLIKVALLIRFGVLNLAAVEMQVTLLVSFRTQKKCHNVRVIKACYHDAKTILYI